MSKYSYDENEMIVSDSQCDLCEYQEKNSQESCEKFKIKPEKVLSNEIVCPFFVRKGRITL